MADKGQRPFGFRDKLGYLMGDFGNDFTFILSSSFLLKFYTDIMGVNAAIVGVIMMIARFVDAVTDVTMGRICDRGKSGKNGKYRPWLLRMCGPVAIASFLMYQSGLASMPMTFKVIYLFITYILWGSVFYTSVNIPYGSMASAISPEPDDRQSLSTFRSMGGLLAGMIIMVLVPLVVYKTLENGTVVMDGGKFTMLAGVFSVLAVGAYLLCYTLTTERVVPQVDKKTFESNSVGRMLRNAVTNRSLLSIIAASIVMLLSQLTMQAMAGYVYPNYYGSATAQSASTGAMGIGMIIAAAIAKPIARKYGKAELSIASNLFAGVMGIVTFIIRPQSVWVFVAMQFLCWFGLGVFTMISWALITDVIDDAELKNGIREDGSVYALYSFARKIGQALSAGLSGFLLSAIGYTAETANLPKVKEGIFNISTLIPSLGFILLALILWFWYPLHKKTVDENVRKLKEMR
ncbi:MAG: glycoside-pentoside-hexuronide (GPH):cation symporter [Candidatus Ornithospirochaeta sp.]|nr:glycoside-pentoside-hexuronide (GPH):cation symporter [Sphaerochaetaceae bacterium]MDY5522978.1 glycoside-pentoside-hexuronide (GPH):cation symporter [Candidatus Ornithospirochaeta sp.]